MQLDELFEYNKALRLFAFGMPYIKHAVSFMRENDPLIIPAKREN